MLDLILSDGRSVVLEDCGDTLGVKLFAENGEFVNEIYWDVDSIVDMLFME